MGKSENICFFFLKAIDWNKTFCKKVVMTNSFALNHDKSLKIYLFCVKRQAKNDFLKDVKSTVANILADQYLLCSQTMYVLKYNLLATAHLIIFLVICIEYRDRHCEAGF